MGLRSGRNETDSLDELQLTFYLVLRGVPGTIPLLCMY